MKINKDVVKSKWVKYKDGVEFKIRPVPNSLVLTGDQDISSTLKKRFVYAIEDWKGMEDQDGKKLKCDDKNKEFVYDYVIEIVQFVNEYLDKLDANLQVQVKN